jgi:DNA-binding transcriptional MerR regulator
MEKSPEAFRTISEVAEFLETPAHVLRFWESRFPQIRPVKRAGGRRYYRPGDVALLSGIKRLLHDEGMTIRGVQKILREQGIRHVAGLVSGDSPEADVEAILAAEFGPKDTPSLPPVEVQTAQIISLEAALVRQEAKTAEVIQPSLWPADPMDAAEAPAPSAWPADPEDDTEAPFIEAVEMEDTVQPHDFPANSEVLAFAPAQQDTPVDADPAVPAPADSAEDAAPVVAETATMAARLRQLAPPHLADRQDELRAIRARMMGLRDRLAEGARRRAK